MSANNLRRVRLTLRELDTIASALELDAATDDEIGSKLGSEVDRARYAARAESKRALAQFVSTHRN